MFRSVLVQARVAGRSSSAISQRTASSSISPKDHLLPSTRFLHTSISSSAEPYARFAPEPLARDSPSSALTTTARSSPGSVTSSFPSPPTPSEPMFLGPNYTHTDAMVVSPTLVQDQKYDYLSVLRSAVASGGGSLQIQFDGEGADGQVVSCRLVLDGRGVVGEGTGVGKGEAMGLAAEDACLNLGLA